MRKVTNTLDRIGSMISTATSSAVIVLTGVMTFIIIINVFSRYLFSNSITWSEEFARYAMVWIVFLGSSIALKQGDHVNIGFLVDLLPSNFKKIINFLTRLVMLFFLYILISKGFDIASKTASQTSSALQISMYWLYLAAPFGGILMAVQLFILMFRELLSKEGEI